MAERRMFSKTIIDSDLFLDMPQSTQLLYFHLSMRADDDGFINNPKKIMRMANCNDDDLRILISKQFIIPFESGIVVIKHWKIHNYIRSDRYKPSNYEEKDLVTLDKNMVYQMDTNCLPNGIPMVDKMDTQVRLGKDRLGKDNNIVDTSTKLDKPTKQPKKFVKPSVDDIKGYCQERNNNVNAQYFFDYYEANGWKVGKNPMKDWKATIRNWERRNFSNNNSNLTVSNNDTSEWGF